MHAALVPYRHNPHYGLTAAGGAVLGTLAAIAGSFLIFKAVTGEWIPTGMDEQTERGVGAGVFLLEMTAIPAGAALLAPRGTKVGAAAGAAAGTGLLWAMHLAGLKMTGARNLAFGAAVTMGGAAAGAMIAGDR